MPDGILNVKKHPDGLAGRFDGLKVFSPLLYIVPASFTDMCMEVFLCLVFLTSS